MPDPAQLFFLIVSAQAILLQKGLGAIDDPHRELRLDQAVFDWNDVMGAFRIKSGDEFLSVPAHRLLHFIAVAPGIDHAQYGFYRDTAQAADSLQGFLD